eukprot:1759323-Lingulodinium_polyedra.AAC.1
MGRSEILTAKGDRCATRRWFSWIQASNSKDRTWHTVLYSLLALGMSVGLYKSATDTPWFRGAPQEAGMPALADQEQPALTGPEEADPPATGALAQTAEEAGVLARRTAEGEAKGPVAQEPESVEAVRKRCKNTMLAVATILSKDSLQQWARMVTLFCGPIYDAHSSH